MFKNLEEVEKLSELGVLFLLFEMGLELSIDRLRVRGGTQRGRPASRQKGWTHRTPPLHMFPLGEGVLPQRQPTLSRPPEPQALAKFAFGMGTLQMLICTVAFALLGLPPGDAFFSQASRRVAGGKGCRVRPWTQSSAARLRCLQVPQPWPQA